MNNVAESVESDPTYRAIIEASRTPSRATVADAITLAARDVAETTEIRAICCFTHSGHTAMLAARERPSVPIIALTPLVPTARRMTLILGVALRPDQRGFPLQNGSCQRSSRGA